MTSPRNRAWRRRKARLLLKHLTETKDWLLAPFKDTTLKSTTKEERKRHKAGKLTHRQDLRSIWAARNELAEGI